MIFYKVSDGHRFYMQYQLMGRESPSGTLQGDGAVIDDEGSLIQWILIILLTITHSMTVMHITMLCSMRISVTSRSMYVYSMNHMQGSKSMCVGIHVWVHHCCTHVTWHVMVATPSYPNLIVLFLCLHFIHSIFESLCTRICFFTSKLLDRYRNNFVFVF